MMSSYWNISTKPTAQSFHFDCRRQVRQVSTLWKILGQSLLPLKFFYFLFLYHDKLDYFGGHSRRVFLFSSILCWFSHSATTSNSWIRPIYHVYQTLIWNENSLPKFAQEMSLTRLLLPPWWPYVKQKIITCAIVIAIIGLLPWTCYGIFTWCWAAHRGIQARPIIVLLWVLHVYINIQDIHVEFL